MDLRPYSRFHNWFGYRLDARRRKIDHQLYAKYGLEDEEVSFIEEKVKAME